MSGGLWRWHFHSEAELRRALEEYSEFHDDAKVQRYGNEGGVSEGSDGKRMRIMRQNSEIDRRMAILEHRAPAIHRVLDIFFRHGLCGEEHGWAIAAKRCGQGARLDGRWDKAAFEHHVAFCVGWLWHVK